MNVDPVTDIFQFACKHADYWSEILFAEEPSTNLTDDEQRAVAAARQHVEDAFLGLLKACRAETQRSAGQDPYYRWLSWSPNTDRIIRRDASVNLALVVRKSIEASLWYAMLTRTVDGTSQKVLTGGLWTQKRHREVLLRKRAEVGVTSRETAHNVIFRDVPVVADVSFAEMVAPLVQDAWSLAVPFKEEVVPRESVVPDGDVDQDVDDEGAPE